MSQPLLILVGPLPPPYHGQSVSFEMLVEGVRQAGLRHQVVDLLPGKSDPTDIGGASGRRAREVARVLLRYWRAIAGARRIIYLTIAQSPHGFLRDLAMIWPARLLGHRIVVHLKGGNYDAFVAAQPRWFRQLVALTLRQVDTVMILGERLRAMYDFEPRLAPKLRVVPNGLPSALPPRPAARTLPGVGAGPVRLLFLSNLVESKGYLDVLTAVNLLVNRDGFNVQADFAGAFLANADDRMVQSASHAQQLFSGYVAEHGLTASVIHHGVVTGDGKRRLLERAHFFLLPTRYDNEGQPVSILEAMGHGLVVISTDYRAIPDMVRDQVTGLLVPFGRPEALADAIAGLLRDPSRYAAMSASARAHLEAGFTRERHLARIIPTILGEEQA